MTGHHALSVQTSRIIALALLLALAARDGVADTRKRAVGGTGGLAVTEDELSGTFGVTAAASFSPRIEITGEIGRIQNVTSPSVRRLVETITGPASFDNFDLPLRAEALVWCGRGGVRLRVTEAVRIAPYLALDGGVARVSPAVKLVSTPQFPIPQIPDFAIRAPTVTSGLVGAGAGILRPLGARILFELGYRYTRILTEDHISVHQARAGLEYRF